jgi:hypothetical protein
MSAISDVAGKGIAQGMADSAAAVVRCPKPVSQL